MNWIIDRVFLIIFSIILSLFLGLGALVFVSKFSTIDLHFFFIAFGYIFLFAWGTISIDLKGKKGKEIILGLIIMLIIGLSMVFLLLIIAYYFKIKFPEKGGAWYSALIGIPMIFASLVIFDIIYKKALKIFLKKKIK